MKTTQPSHPLATIVKFTRFLRFALFSAFSSSGSQRIDSRFSYKDSDSEPTVAVNVKDLIHSTPLLFHQPCRLTQYGFVGDALTSAGVKRH